MVLLNFPAASFDLLKKVVLIDIHGSVNVGPMDRWTERPTDGKTVSCL